MLKMIFKPLDYTKIVWGRSAVDSSGFSKKFIDIYLPMVLAALLGSLVLVLYNFSNFTIFFISEGFYYLTCFLQTLPGFYIAALAAIVSFKNDMLDEIDEDEGPIDCQNYNMTFRRFLSNALSYLAWISIFLILLSVALKYVFEQNQYDYFGFDLIYFVLLFSYFFFLVQLLNITAMSLSYLGDRIHRP